MSEDTPAEILFIPGVPGLDLDADTVQSNPYPSMASDFRKALLQTGASVRYLHEKADRVEVSHNAADIWLPILALAGDGSLNIALNMIASALYDLFVKHKIGSTDSGVPPVLHVEIRKNATTGDQLLRVDGPPDKAIEAIKLLRDSI